MNNALIEKFRIRQEKEDVSVIIESIDKGVVFKGTNLWVLIFAIFIASLGLNVNSTAVIIGAMLISPLMGPIMGIGLAVGINDLPLLRKSIYNYCVATGAALATSTLFFLLSPLDDAHSEILARTSPNIYDVLIALFGGLAGIIATSSKQKGNVIPGVAIATALMPPLCTAGYGLATLQFYFFTGAFYLFIINTVFIALATFITTRFLKFPFKHLPDKKADTRAQRIIWGIVILTILPSIYFGYDLVQQDKFVKKANQFVELEAKFPNDYLLQKNIDPKKKSITLTYGGAEIVKEDIARLQQKLKSFDLGNASLEINQGFAYLAAVKGNTENNEQAERLNFILKAKETELQALQHKMDSLQQFNAQGRQLFDEIKTQYPDINSLVLSAGNDFKSDTISRPTVLVALSFSGKRSSTDKGKIENWLKTRLRNNALKVYFQ
ncbi:DUF389 domain-containing protein [Paraflavitalea soli]|uniref:DUF389 domain-containing protein n=1 Tax=Paraflavitalea soli TaxID=2315862 RepID=A0A3B7MWP3_9BACT|nr:DUF389 domain-containing protein [Paraflavitalea soli]AXY77629.1 DUF389 domain-containing protein [Paraflavitalea soli]